VGYLIVLSGFAGSGKDTIGKELIKKLGGDDQARLLDLDITGPLEKQFNKSLQETLCCKHVIAMLFWGDAHTENPESWINNFKNRNYTILSVILDGSLNTLIQRVKERGHNYKPPEEMKQRVHEFNQLRDCFASKAGIREIPLDTEGKSTTQVAEEILTKLK